jgi:glycosyltransferase involved in cell wall biosynthesis
MMCNILTFNNYVGILTDAILLEKIISKVTPNVKIVFLDNIDESYKSDFAVWIQNYHLHMLDNFKINIFFINEEWFDRSFDDLKKFDFVVCKSKHAYNLLHKYCNCIYLPFVSPDYFNPSIIQENKMLHFMGRSIQKNTELVLKQTHPLTLIDPYNRYRPNSNIFHINTYQSNDQLMYLLNTHSIHVCISLYESWGHYLFEGLSTGAEIICSDIPVFKEQLDPSLVHFLPAKQNTDLTYLFDNDNRNNLYPLRTSYYVDPIEFRKKLDEFVPIGHSEKRRQLYKDIMETNSSKLFKFFESLLR